MGGDPSELLPQLDEQQPLDVPVPGLPAPPPRRRKGRKAKGLKLQHHVEGTVEPWSQRPHLPLRDMPAADWRPEPLDLTGPAPAEAQQLLAAAEEMRHLAELGALTSAVAHEIRNPLAGIAATAEVLRSTLDGDDERREGIETILGEAARLDKLVSDLLDFARCREPHLLEADVADDVACVVRAVAEDAKAAAVEIAVETPDTCTPVLIDSQLTQHVFRHLAANAIEAMPRGGTLTIRTRRPDAGSRYVCVQFIDTGTGIQADDASRVFDPFFTTRPGGVGLGLAAARRLVEAQGGYLTVESTPGSGTCFTVYLPRADEARS